MQGAGEIVGCGSGARCGDSGQHRAEVGQPQRGEVGLCTPIGGATLKLERIQKPHVYDVDVNTLVGIFGR